MSSIHYPIESAQVVDEPTQILVTGKTLRWYKSKGYTTPDKFPVNGFKTLVSSLDLTPGSCLKVTIKCPECGILFKIPRYKLNKRKSPYCKICLHKVPRLIEGEYQDIRSWTKRLIDSNNSAKCDICGETDKRFLQLHHLTPIAAGGRNIESNLVILSANYHSAFHNHYKNGVVDTATPEDYYAFREQELRLL